MTTKTTTNDYTQEELQSLVIQAIADNCSLDSPHSDLRTVAASVSAGHEIELKILTGGLCNYSYRISVPTDPKAPSLFAKLALPYALWFGPDHPIPVERLENECKMMNVYQNAMPESQRQNTITPYFCAEVSGMKLLVTQWSPIDVALGNQFSDGCADIRVAANLAEQLAALHSLKCADEDCDDTENVDSTEKDDISMFMKFFGKTELFRDYSQTEMEEMDSLLGELGKRKQCYSHTDAHAFNILVGEKPSIEEFDEDGNVVLIDWEGSKRSYPGDDLGNLYGFPVSCILAHTLNGNTESVENTLNFLDTFWEEYCSRAQVESYDNEDFSQIYRQLLTRCGLYLMGNTLVDAHMQYLPLEKNNAVAMAKAKKSQGIIGLKFFRIGIGLEDPNLSLPELRQKFKSIITEEKRNLLPVQKRRSTRRSSVLQECLVGGV
jgi:thiamine kinase-like enzyme